MATIDEIRAACRDFCADHYATFGAWPMEFAYIEVADGEEVEHLFDFDGIMDVLEESDKTDVEATPATPEHDAKAQAGAIPDRGGPQV